MLLPRVKLLLYHQNMTVSRTGMGCLRVLASLAPSAVTQIVTDFAYRALDPEAAHHSHLVRFLSCFPSASTHVVTFTPVGQIKNSISLLSATFVPLMWPRPFLAPHLPKLLHTTLSGLDVNDDMKTLITLMLYSVCASPCCRFVYLCSRHSHRRYDLSQKVLATIPLSDATKAESASMRLRFPAYHPLSDAYMVRSPCCVPMQRLTAVKMVLCVV
jgi:Proteasome-substrate-size regulator, mid region